MNVPYKAIDYIVANAPKYAKAKAERIYLEEFRKTKKALLMKVAMEMGYEQNKLVRPRKAAALYQ